MGLGTAVNVLDGPDRSGEIDRRSHGRRDEATRMLRAIWGISPGALYEPSTKDLSELRILGEETAVGVA